MGPCAPPADSDLLHVGGCIPHHAGVPDLLFEDVLLARVEALAGEQETLERDARAPLHRVTLFLSYACNLRCPYCKTIARTPVELAARPQKGITYTLEQLRRLLDGYAGTVEHLHFTGGEASIVPGVVEMVAEAARRGIPHLSMTTNGTTSAKRYVELVHAGLTELRVSIDARDAALGAKVRTGSTQAWSKSIEAVKAVAAARDAGAKVRLVANTVVGPLNRVDLPGIVRFLLSLGPDDVKLITEVDARDSLTDFPEYGGVRAALKALVEALPTDRYPLLRRKLKTVFARDSIGLEPTAKSRERGCWRCYIPLTERTVDGVGYYPCSVYLREGGAPIGPLTDSAAEQRRATASWVKENDCRTDPICQRYCLHCTRVFNDELNKARQP